MMMLGGEELKTPEIELSGNVAGNLNVWLTDSDYESEYNNEGLVEEEKLEEIMRELYREITTTTSSYNTYAPPPPPPPPPPPTVTFPSPSSSSSSPSPLSLSSLPFFPVSVSDVKSQSCGASVSDSSSTVMAGIKFVGPSGKLPGLKIGLPENGNESPENEFRMMGMGIDDNNNIVGGGRQEKMDSCDEGDVENDDDQWLARVLGWGPLEIEEWT